uniref:EGF-like domain-containing protein n=1 Tax=Steinernema glaseri TaxID=37863 RepID=A0A1I8ADA6_9BILA
MVSYLTDDCTTRKLCLQGQIYTEPHQCTPNSHCGREAGEATCLCNNGFKRANQNDVNSKCVPVKNTPAEGACTDADGTVYKPMS